MATGEATPSGNDERYCPVCGERTSERICPEDGTRTVLKQKFSKDALAYEPGDLVNERYRITGILGRGGFGAVYAAEHTGTGQGVALKMLTLDTSMDEGGEHTKRFFQEARMTAQLAHPNTVRVFDVGQAAEGPLFIAMEMLRGPSLAQYLRDVIDKGDSLSEAATLDIAIPMLKSLGEAHRTGLVHRDIKPANVILHQGPDDDTIVKLLDFGIARAANSELTATGRALGTPSYMSPEQCTGQPLDGRSDLYAVGILMFLCATGKLPFAGDDSMAVMFMQVNAPVPDVRTLTKHTLSDEFVAALTHSLEKVPADRFSDAREMRRVLEAVRGGAWGGTPTFGLDTETALRTVGASTVNHTTGQRVPGAAEDPAEEETRASDQLATVSKSADVAPIAAGYSDAKPNDSKATGALAAGPSGDSEDATIAAHVTPARVVSSASIAASSVPSAVVAAHSEESATVANVAAIVPEISAAPAASPVGGASKLNPTMVMAGLALLIATVAAAAVLSKGTPTKAPVVPSAATEVAPNADPTPAAKPTAPAAPSAQPVAAPAGQPTVAKAAKPAAAPQAKPVAAPAAPTVTPAQQKAAILMTMSKSATDLEKQLDYALEAKKLAPSNPKYDARVRELLKQKTAIDSAKRHRRAKAAAKAAQARQKAAPKPAPKPKTPSAATLQPAFAD